MQKYVAEMIGTIVLVLMGCGSVVIAGSEVGFWGITFAFGLSVVAMAYTIGSIFGCHINPVITLGVFLMGRMNGKDVENVYVISVDRYFGRFGNSLCNFFRDGIGRNGSEYV